MQFVVLTLFPELFEPFWKHSMVRRALEFNKISGETIWIREYAEGKHRTADDRPYGGGPGMVMKPEPLAGAIREASRRAPDAVKILLTPQGRPFSQILAKQLVQEKGLIFICGRYEGVDERICQQFVDIEISIGDYVLTGGELPAMVIIDAVVRLIPGVLGSADSAQKDSFSDQLLEYAQYTRPAVFENEPVPEVLLSGNHGETEKWRIGSSLIRTLLKRPELLKKKKITAAELDILKKWRCQLDDIIERHELP